MSLTFPIGEGRTLTVEGDNPDQLYSLIDRLGGASDEIKTLVSDALENPHVFAPEVLSAELATQTLEPASTESSASPSDPWDDGGLPDEPADDDPWSEPSTPTTASKSSQTGRSPSSSTSSADASSSDSYVVHDRFGRKFQHGLPEAPKCDHGLPAAKMTAKKRSGKGNYSKWVCPKVKSKDDNSWKDKCEFEDWAS